jgi:hypothetical protein
MEILKGEDAVRLRSMLKGAYKDSSSQHDEKLSRGKGPKGK